MKNIKLYPTIWQTAPYSLYMVDALGGADRKPVKDLTLVNKEILEKGISEMNLNVSRFAAIEENGSEHLIPSFKKQTLNLKGWHTGLYMRSKEGLKLSSGTYTALRFYIDNQGENSMAYCDRRTAELNDLKYIDFEIEDKLHINTDETSEIILRFEFVPFTFSSYFNPIIEFFKKQIQSSTKLVRSFGS